MAGEAEVLAVHDQQSSSKWGSASPAGVAVAGWVGVEGLRGVVAAHEADERCAGPAHHGRGRPTIECTGTDERVSAGPR